MKKNRPPQHLQRNAPVNITGAPPNAGTTHGQQLTTEFSLTYQSPLPPPEVLRQYESVLSGSPERFMGLVEGEAKHRRSMEKWLVKGGVLQAYVGMLFGLIIGLFGLYVAWDLASNGQPWVAGVIAALDITSLVGVFVWGAMRMRNHRQVQPQTEDATETESD